MRPSREDLAFEAGWRAGFETGKHHPGAELAHQDKALTADWEAYKRETAEPARCGCCGTMINQGALCSACRISD